MAFTTSDVRAIADYARIAVPDNELDALREYLDDIVATLEPITHFNLEGVEPTFHPAAHVVNVMRQDVPSDDLSLDHEHALENAPQAQDNCFRVPTILGGEH